MRFCNKSSVFEAIQLRWDTWNEVCDFAGVGKLADGQPEGCLDDQRIGLNIPSPGGSVHVSAGDWIIRGVAGELFACRNDVFLANYVRVIADTED